MDRLTKILKQVAVAHCKAPGTKPTRSRAARQLVQPTITTAMVAQQRTYKSVIHILVKSKTPLKSLLGWRTINGEY
jgi:hypothetical protein